MISESKKNSILYFDGGGRVGWGGFVNPSGFFCVTKRLKQPKPCQIWPLESTSTQSKILRPSGAGHLSLWIQLFSTLSLSTRLLLVLGGSVMNARTEICRSLVP